VTVSKALTLNGPKAGVNGTRAVVPANEAIVDPAVSAPNAPIFMLEANGITLNGFLIEDNTANVGVQTRPTSSGYRILNNIVRQNVIGIYLHGSGDATTLIRRNLIQGNNQLGAANGNGIYPTRGRAGSRSRRTTSGTTRTERSPSGPRLPAWCRRASSSRTTGA
jgi:parallel beta-helix repeat protein